MKLLTDFGDLAVLLPVSAALFLWLLAMRSSRGAVWWLIAFALCIGGTAILKVYFSACPVGTSLRSPSGHGSFSTLAYGALAAVIAIETSAIWQRRLALAAIAVLVIGIAVSRLALRAHSVPEILLGLSLGLVALGVFAYGYRRNGPAAASIGPLLFAVVLVVTLFYGRELHAEQILNTIGRYLHMQIGPSMCV